MRLEQQLKPMRSRIHLLHEQFGSAMECDREPVESLVDLPELILQDQQLSPFAVLKVTEVYV